MSLAGAIAGRLRTLTTRVFGTVGEAKQDVAVEIKSKSEIEKMRATCRLAAQVLDFIEPHVVPGVTTGELDRLCHDFIVKHGAYPSPLNYKGFPKSICTSVNEVVCHGIPGEQVLKAGDIINLDITTTLDGYFGDCSELIARLSGPRSGGSSGRAG